MVISMPLYRKVQAGLDKILGRTRQNLTGVRVIRAFDKEEAEKVDFNNENQTLTNMQLLVGKIAALTNPMTYILLNAALVVLLYVGAIRAVSYTHLCGKSAGNCSSDGSSYRKA